MPHASLADQQAALGQAQTVATTVNNQGRTFRLTAVQELEVMDADIAGSSAVHPMPQEQVNAWEPRPGAIPAPFQSPSFSASGPLSACGVPELYDEEVLDSLRLPPHIPAHHEVFYEGLKDIPVGGGDGMSFMQGSRLAGVPSEYFQDAHDPALQSPASSRRGSHGNGNGWRCSVKNGFIHVEQGRLTEYSSTVYPSNPDNDFEDSYEGSSQRSSSAPSRIDHDNSPEDRNRRQRNLDRATSDSLARMDFDWGLPVPCKRSWMPTSKDDEDDFAPFAQGADEVETIGVAMDVDCGPDILPAFLAPNMRISA